MLEVALRYTKILIFFICIVIDNFLTICVNDRTALVIVPVIDAVGESLADKYNLYSNFEYAPEKGKFACVRLHQFLFNELLTIIKETDKEIFFKFESLFYCDDKKIIRNTFWVPKEYLKDKIVYLREINKDNFDAIPKSYINTKSLYEFEKNNISKVNTHNILTLISPWYDIVTNKTYSAGTRFVRVNKYDYFKNKAGFYAIKLLDKNLNKVISYVNKDLAIINYGTGKKSQINLFLEILQSFIGDSRSIIPYVWGGCSYINRFTNNNFYIKEIDQNGINNKAWSRVNISDTKVAKTGFECSSLILRAAQIAGMPYFAKNSEAIVKTLKPLKLGQKVESGDILWYKGHVLVISDINKNLIMESVGYPLYYGKLHQLELNKVFKDINNYKELLDIYLKNGQLRRLNKFGKIVKTIPKFLILKLDSLYD